ncbi:Predicted protein carboxyl methylase [Plasmopara halstedii]|uniref:Uncharacterized protein n=1 Tax=Plasmopara halstedii TaxID=4781 RepID=A0A0P1A4I3_PLAHL|nr:Predicted protein carboxyl methylase [Plasmopara halstedii]CEG35350.1 Predicted protein carboxyl methylase [Plasmopara halstedii]|eukprot:XP_024571719.1 Predicted protein carboxyl methylase [Plasmopara halstedii]
MPYKSLRPEERGNALSTSFSSAALEFYSEKQSDVYTTSANARLQEDLTRHALELLFLDLTCTRAKADVLLLLDVGAGSGLSTKAAQKWSQEKKISVFTLAFDISASMLSLAAKETRLCTEFYRGNAAQSFPIRCGILDGAIGISMLQWLQPRGLEVCFSSLFKLLSDVHDSRVVFQVYPSSKADVDKMEMIAIQMGFYRAEAFISFPHMTSAKKWFICLEKRISSQTHHAQEEKHELCIFARRYDRRCVLQWLGNRDGNVKEIWKRVEKEHVKIAWHIWRKYRRYLVNVETDVKSDKISLIYHKKMMHTKAQQTLSIYPSDETIGRALKVHFEERAEKITLDFLQQHSAEVVRIVHSAYTEARKRELAMHL